MLILAGLSLMVSPEPPSSVGVLVPVGAALVALSTLGMLGRWVSRSAVAYDRRP